MTINMRGIALIAASSACHGSEWIRRSLASSVEMILVSVVRRYWRPRCVEWTVLAAVVSELIAEITGVATVQGVRAIL
jgi:hypothetical protein